MLQAMTGRPARHRSALSCMSRLAGFVLLIGVSNGALAMDHAIFEGWVKDWQAMEAIAKRRGWEVTPLKIGPKATARAIQRAERAAVASRGTQSNSARRLRIERTPRSRCSVPSGRSSIPAVSRFLSSKRMAWH